MHWRTADEWAYVLYGNARVTLMNPDGTTFIAEVSEGDLWIFPAGFPHSIQGLGPDGTEFLPVFNQGNFSEDGTMLLSEWVAHTPSEVLAKNTGLEASIFDNTPGAPLYIFPGMEPGSLEQDKAEIGGRKGCIQIPVHLPYEVDGANSGEQRRIGPDCGLAELPGFEAHRCRPGDDQALRPA